MNAITLIGHLPADARGSKTKSGQHYGLLFTVEVADRIRTAGGGFVTQPIFFECVYVGKRAERMEPTLKRGTQVAVRGTFIIDPLDDSKIVSVDDVEVVSVAT